MTRLGFAAIALMMSNGAVAQTAPAAPGTGVTVPQGATVNVQPTEATLSTPLVTRGRLPRCSRTVTDRCTRIQIGRGGKVSSRKHRRIRRPR